MEFFQANIKLGEVLVQLIAFVIVFMMLKGMAWKPILQALESRRARIREEFEKIASARKEIASLKSQYTASLQKIEEEARMKIQEAVEDGRRIAKEIQDKARTESQTTFEKAKQNLDLEVAKARITLRQEIADLAVNTSERVLNERLASDRAQQAKIFEIIEDLEKTL